jgi:DNA-binding NarL/FixJ family response regulator
VRKWGGDLARAENAVRQRVERYQVSNILTKPDVRDRTQAAIRARQLGIV